MLANPRALSRKLYITSISLWWIDYIQVVRRGAASTASVLIRFCERHPFIPTYVCSHHSLLGESRPPAVSGTLRRQVQDRKSDRGALSH